MVDHRTFDTVVQMMATRRAAVRSGAAMVLGVSQISQPAHARCKSVGAKCNERKCCAGARCKRGRCRCKSGRPLWANVCCRDRFVETFLGQKVEEGTPLCCPPERVCPQTGDPFDDDCCADNAPCIGGQCCCDGCRGTVVCGGTCCPSGSCCNGACCGSGQVCAESSPGVRSCVAAERNCVSDAQCYPGESCWGNVCCTAERMCREPNGPGLVNPVCCATSHYCDAADVCCPNGGDCSTGKKVRIRV